MKVSNRLGSSLVTILLSGVCVAPCLAESAVVYPWNGKVRGQKDDAASAAVETRQGTLTFFADRTTFDLAFPSLPSEDFEAGTVAPGAVATCAAPLDATGDGVCFAAGGLAEGVIFQDDPGPNAIDGLLLVGDGALGNGSKVLASNSLGDALEIVFPEPVEAVGLDLFNFPGAADAVTVEVFSPAGVSLGEVSTPSSETGEFWGVSSPNPIASLLITSTINESEGIDNVSFGVVPFLVLDGFTTTDLCALEAANQNGIWEPGEIIELAIELRASGGDFTNVTAALAGNDPGVVVLAGASGWPDLPRGTSGVNTETLRFVLDGDLCDQTLELTLTVSTDQGTFQVPIRNRVGSDQAPDVPMPIPDAGAAAVSTITVGTAAVVANLQVDVDIVHTWVGDLTISLESPAGTTAVLLDRPGVPMTMQGCNNNNVRVTFSDAAVVDPEGFCNAASSDPWINGQVIPAEALSAFDGEATEGDWVLRVTDSLAGDLGTVAGWRLGNDDPLGEECVECGSQSDLAMVKTCTGAPALGCSLEVINLGPSVALGIEVTDALPPPVAWASDDCGAGPPAAGVLTWNVGTLEVGASALCNLSLTAPLSSADEVVNVATVTAQTADPDLSNNSAEASISLGTLLDVPTLDTWAAVALISVLLGLSLARLRRS